MIPNKVNFIWIGKIPHWVSHNIACFKELNPEWEVKVYDESFLDPAYYDIYDSVSDMCQKSDLLRLSVLKRFPGWYFDCDFIFLEPMSTILKECNVTDSTSLFITKQWAGDNDKVFANGFLGIGNDFEYWQDLDDMVQKVYASGSIERTSFGPLLFTRFMKEILPDNAVIGRWENFYWHRPRERALFAYEQILAGAITTVLPSTHKVFTIHLWIGGNYELLKKYIRSNDE